MSDKNYALERRVQEQRTIHPNAPAQSVDERIEAAFEAAFDNPKPTPLIDRVLHEIAARGLAVVDAKPASASRVEAIARDLAENANFADNMVPGYVWPEHDNDDGYRGHNSYVRIIPADVVAKRREDAACIIRNDPLTAVSAQMRQALQLVDMHNLPLPFKQRRWNEAKAAYDKLVGE